MIKKALLDTSRKLHYFKKGDELRRKNIFLARFIPGFSLGKMLMVLLFLLIVPGFVFAQETSEVEIRGQVLDQNNNPIPGAIVIFNDQVGTAIEEARSDARGVYEAIVPQGTYSITALGPEGTDFISTTFNNREVFTEEEINFYLLQALPDQTSTTSSTNIVFYGLIAAVVLGVGGFGVFLYIKSLRRRRSS